ncbi:hypothetical protein IKF15_02840 [Candidatus Saccharibacteria bacterium]|nr:hypothetical protein [Candidatus Saccharibacteria bacterium]
MRSPLDSLLRELKRRRYFKDSSFETRRNIQMLLKETSIEKAQKALEKLDEANISRIRSVFRAKFQIVLIVTPNDGTDDYSIFV